MAQDNLPQNAEDYGPDLITLEDENGRECTFEVVDATDVKDVHYLAVVPCAQEPENLNEEAVLIIMRVGTDDQGEYMDIVDDDDELYEVSKVFEKRLRDQFDIDDEELRS